MQPCLPWGGDTSRPAIASDCRLGPSAITHRDLKREQMKSIPTRSQPPHQLMSRHCPGQREQHHPPHDGVTIPGFITPLMLTECHCCTNATLTPPARRRTVHWHTTCVLRTLNRPTTVVINAKCRPMSFHPLNASGTKGHTSSLLESTH